MRQVCASEIPLSSAIYGLMAELARSTRDLLNTMDTINEAGGKFQSVSGPWANTTTHAGKMIMTVFAGIAEFERDLIRERTGAGREAAKQRGVRFGRPRKLNSDQTEVAAQAARRRQVGSRHRKGRSTYTGPRFTAWLLRREELSVWVSLSRTLRSWRRIEMSRGS